MGMGSLSSSHRRIRRPSWRVCFVTFSATSHSATTVMFWSLCWGGTNAQNSSTHRYRWQATHVHTNRLRPSLRDYNIPWMEVRFDYSKELNKARKTYNDPHAQRRKTQRLNTIINLTILCGLWRERAVNSHVTCNTHSQQKTSLAPNVWPEVSRDQITSFNVISNKASNWPKQSSLMR